MTSGEIIKSRTRLVSFFSTAYPLPKSPDLVKPEHIELAKADALWEIALQLAKLNERDTHSHLHISAADSFSEF